jgi:hypothetical protein
LAAVALQARHQVALGRSVGRHDDLHVGGAVAGGLQPFRHLVHGDGARAGRIGRIGLDQFLEDLAQLVLYRRQVGRGRVLRRAARHRHGQQAARDGFQCCSVVHVVASVWCY